MPRLRLRRREPTIITRADRARAAGEWQLAAGLYHIALERTPNNPPIWIQYGHALKESGSPVEAETAYRTAIAYDPEDAEAHLQLGHLLKLRGKRAEAEAAYRRASTLDPMLTDAARELAAFGWTEQRLAETDRSATISARDKPHVAMSINGSAARSGRRRKEGVITRADRARSARQWPLAARLYRKALDRNPDNPPIWVQYGHALKESGDPAEAERAYRTAISYAPSVADTHLQLGHALKLQGKTEEAQAAYLRAFALDPALPHPGVELGGLGWPASRLSELQRIVVAEAPRPDSPARSAMMDPDAQERLVSGSGFFETHPGELRRLVATEGLRLGSPDRSATTKPDAQEPLVRDSGFFEPHPGELQRLVATEGLRPGSPDRSATTKPDAQERLVRDSGFFEPHPGELRRLVGTEGLRPDSPDRSATTKPDAQERLPRDSWLFDSAWYLARYPDVSEAGVDPIAHYFRKGAAEGRDPHPLFNTDWYLTMYPDVARAGINPLFHYLSVGAAEGRDPNPLFDSDWYLTKYPDVARAGINPLLHYFSVGATEGRDPNPLFDSDWYLTKYPDVARAAINPLFDYLSVGAAEGRDPNPLFDSDWYLTKYPDVARAGINPLVHYMCNGGNDGRAPQSLPIDAFEAWLGVNVLSAADVKELREALADRYNDLPLISLITPVYNTDPAWLDELVNSVLAQVYDRWELCFADDASPAPHIRSRLAELSLQDPRIKVTYLGSNRGISGATNAAVEIASGEIIAFLDHDDLITPDCLAEIALYYADHPEADIVYSDDDKIDRDRRRFAPQFKPDWSPILLLSYMYMAHMFTVRRSLFQDLGGFRPAFDGSQDYDFALRAAERARHVGHIPKILYHWRVVPGSTASSGAAKPGSMEAGRAAVEEAVQRRAIPHIRVIHPAWAASAGVGMFEIEFPDTGPSVCIAIPTRNEVNLLATCIESLALTTYRNYEILVVDNESDDVETLSYLAALMLHPRCRIVRIANDEGNFFAGLMNRALDDITADYVLLLNNDTKLINPRWLSQMVGYMQMEGVGSVGARLFFPDETVQHAGIVHGYHGGLPGHAFRGKPRHDWGYMGFMRAAREYSAVTAACLLTKRTLFQQLGGFDETNFCVAYNDVDYGFRLLQAGYRNIYCPQAELYHYEGKSRGYSDNPVEVVAYRKIYSQWKDRYYNPNLSLENEGFEPAATRPETRRLGPVTVVLVSHNLNQEGAPAVLLDLAVGLVKRGVMAATVLSPADGPLRAAYEAAGIPVRLIPDVSHAITEEQFIERREHLGKLMLALGAEVVLANTLSTFWAVSAAEGVGLSSVWCQHESEDWQTYFDYLPLALRDHAYNAFAQAYRVLYVAEATKCSWQALATRRNFAVIRYALPPERLGGEVAQLDRADARMLIGADENDVVVVLVGTVCRRKGQLDLVEALDCLPPPLQNRLRVFIAGALVEQPYVEEVRARIAQLAPAARHRVILVGSVPDPFLYFSAADVAVCTSRVESAPRVILEMMAFKLPIVTTPVFGIPEQVRENVNALFYEPGDVGTLAEHLATLADDHDLRARLASKSRDVLDSLPDFEAMMVQYARVLRQAAMLAVPSAVDPNPHAPRRFHPRRAKSDELGGSLAGEYFSIEGTGVGGSGIALVSETAQDLCVSGAFPGRHPAY